MTVAELDALPEPAVRELLTACCGAAPWLRGMIAARPWRDRPGLFAAADRHWTALTSAEIAGAIAHHPRLGEAHAAVVLDARASAWSASEQAGMGAADAAARAALARGNAEYERRFGHTFILCASGLTIQDMLAALQGRLAHDAAEEQLVTARELHRITRLRLEKLLAGAASAHAEGS